MKKIIITILLVIIVVVAGLVAFIYSGAYDIGTSNHDSAPINWALGTGMTRSVIRHAQGITAPPLTDPAMIQAGFRDFHEMCVSCHGAPGVMPGEIAKGIWPAAPDLSMAASDWTPAQLFWITKNGIKFSAMPAWGPTHDDGKIWAMVAFLEKLPQLSSADYQAMEQKATSAPYPHGLDTGH